MSAEERQYPHTEIARLPCFGEYCPPKKKQWKLQPYVTFCSVYKYMAHRSSASLIAKQRCYCQPRSLFVSSAKAPLRALFCCPLSPQSRLRNTTRSGKCPDRSARDRPLAWKTFRLPKIRYLSRAPISSRLQSQGSVAVPKHLPCDRLEEPKVKEKVEYV